MYLLLPLLLPVVQETAPEPRPVLVPLGRSIELDGRLAPEEWQGAARHELAAGGELFLQHDERYLYLALRSPKPGLMHAYLFVEEEIRVHHASAALGNPFVRSGP